MRVVVAHDHAGQPIQVVHDGVAYGSGEALDVANPLAQFWITSGWAHAKGDAGAEVADAPSVDTDDEADANAEDLPEVKPAPKVARSHRRDPRKSKAD